MTRQILRCITLIFLLSGCAFYPETPKLAQFNPKAGYRYENLRSNPQNSESLFVLLTFSGGGTRAAALSYGIMEKLRETKIMWKGRKRRLLDEVDVISSVSGGSFTSAYYGLFREEIFDPKKYEKVFLYRNIEAELIETLLNPFRWRSPLSPFVGRIELAADLYDREIFRGKKFDHLIHQGERPYILLNATDITQGAQFTFVQRQFDPICSNLGEVRVARAVAASSNFPVAFNPMTINNYAGACGYQEPDWVAPAAKDLDINPPRYMRGRVLRSYLDSRKRPYVHLLDGGVADNIGLRGPLSAIRSNDLPWSIVNRINLGKVEKLVVIVVDARTNPKTKIDKSAFPPKLSEIVEIIASVPMSNYSFDTVQQLLDTMEQWKKDRLVYKGCSGILKRACPGAKMPTPPPPALDTYPIYVGFDQIKDDNRRDHFLNLPTTFYLPKKEVDELRMIGPEILMKNENYKKLLKDLK